MKKTNSEKGSISVFVIVAFIFCMTILINMYWSNTNNQVTVLQAQQRVQDIYGEDVNNIDEIHNELKSDGSILVKHKLPSYSRASTTTYKRDILSRYE